MGNAPIIRVLLALNGEVDAPAIKAAFASTAEGAEPGFASSVEEALVALNAAPFDFVAASARLPDGGAGDIAERFPLVPCVALGQASEKAELEAALEGGAADYLILGKNWAKDLGPYLHRLWRIRRRLSVDMGRASKRYQDLVEALPDIVYELDTAGRFTFVNQSVRILGYSPEELLGKHFSDLLFPEDVPHVSRDQVLPMFVKNRTGARNSPKLFDERRGIDRKTENLELRMRRKGGEALGGGEVFASVISYGEIASAGAYRSLGDLKEKVFVGTVGIIRDITLRRKSEDMLRRMYQAVDQSPSAVAILDREFKIEYVNPAFFALTGAGPEQALGTRVGDFLGDQVDGSGYEDLSATIKAGIDWKGELRCPRIGAEPYWAQVAFSAIRAPSGKISHYLCLMEDVTRKRALDDLLRQAKDSAQQSSLSKSEFLAGLSQDLRGPLTSIADEADGLLAGSADVGAAASSMKASALALRGMIDDLLDLSRIESKTVEIKIEEFDLAECAAAATAPYRVLAEEKGLSFRSVVEDGGFPLVATDRARLVQIVSNLVSNAVKFTEEGSVDVRFAVRAKEGVPALFVSVRDTGIGISGVDQQKLFKHFSQVDPAVAKKYGGAGLGLAIAKELALRLGGDVWVESAPGLGSTFSFFVPVRGSGDAIPPKADDDLRAPRVLSLLVAEGNPVNREHLVFLLEKAGHSTRAAQDGYEAIALLEKGDFDAVLMDLRMPGLDGPAAARAIRSYAGPAFDPGIPILALSSFGSEDPGADLDAAGFDGSVPKPVNARALVSLLDDIVRKKERIDLEKMRKQFAGGADELRRQLLAAAHELPKCLSDFQAAHRADDPEAAKAALHGMVAALSPIGAARALQLVKRYRRCVKDGEGTEAAAADIGFEVAILRKQIKKALSDLR